MLKLTPQRRLQIPHGLAIFAAVLLIGSSVAGIGASQNDLVAKTENEITVAAQSMEKDIHVIGETVTKKSHALKLGLQLFQR